MLELLNRVEGTAVAFLKSHCINLGLGQLTSLLVLILANVMRTDI